MAATENGDRGVRGTVGAMACLLPGVLPGVLWPGTAQAQDAADGGGIAVQRSHYMEWQARPDGTAAGGTDIRSGASGRPAPVGSGQRVGVSSLMARLVTPEVSGWSLESVLTSDAVSGATPAYHADLSSAAWMSDRRRAWDLRLTRADAAGAWRWGSAGSRESDYLSRSRSLHRVILSEDRAHAWTFGLALTADRMPALPGASPWAARRTTEWEAGWSFAWSAKDLVQVAVTTARGRGHHGDPYKYRDLRPPARDATALSWRWRRAEGPWVLQGDWRRYADSWAIRADTVSWGLARRVGAWVVTPQVRIHRQSAAEFFRGPGPDGLPTPPLPPDPFSADNRLSALQSITVGGRLEWDINHHWTLSTRYLRHEQWHRDPTLTRTHPEAFPTLRSRILQVGLQHRFR